MTLAWGAKVSAEFRRKVVEIAGQLGTEASWLMACMAFETGRTFDPAKRNPATNATGLIQFMPATAIHLGTSIEALAQMTAEEQLDFVLRYLTPFAGRLTTLASCYMAILWPPAVGEPDDAAIFASGSDAYLKNRGLDFNHDGAVTKAEAASFVEKMLDEGLRPENATDTEEAPMPESTAQAPSLGAGIANVIATLAPLAGPWGAALGIAVKAFSPLLQDKLEHVLERHADNPQVAQAVAQNIVTAMQDATGKHDPVEAAVEIHSNPAVAAQAEQVVVAKVEEQMPLFDRIAEYQEKSWEAEEASRDAAAQRMAGAGEYDNRMILTRFGVYGMGIATALVGILLMIQIYFDPEHKASGEVLTLFIAMVTWTMAKVSTLFDNAYGTSRTSAAKDAVLAQLAKK